MSDYTKFALDALYRAQAEMRYAGWGKIQPDNRGRFDALTLVEKAIALITTKADAEPKFATQTPMELLRQSEREGWRYSRECKSEIIYLKMACLTASIALTSLRTFFCDESIAYALEAENLLGRILAQHANTATTEKSSAVKRSVTTDESHLGLKDGL